MKRYISITLIFSIFIGCTKSDSRINQSDFNLDFESINNGKPLNWRNNSQYAKNYIFSLDSLDTYSGNYSVSLAYDTGEFGFSTWAYSLPSYKGKKITLSGYIKTENVHNGYAGLWMRIDPGVALNNMSNQGVVGTTEWRKYNITLALNPDVTENIVIGGILQGKGKAWFDDLSVKIDGKNIDMLEFIKSLPAKEDKEFTDGSGITNVLLDSVNVENLKQLGLVWGFVKYYHPAVAAGNHNFDFELFRILPQLLGVESKKAKSDIFIQWIENLGEIGKTGKGYIKNDKTFITPDFEWINTDIFTPELVDLLLTIKNSERQDKSYYISKTQIGVPNFREERYENLHYPDMGYRFLTLYRFWNIIQYFFPYKHLIGENWEDVLKEFIPKFANAGNELDYIFAVLELVTRINDTHAQLSSSTLASYQGNRLAVPQITFIKDSAVVTWFKNDSLQYRTELESGDIILSINNRPVNDIVKEQLAYTPASNYPTKLRNIALNLMRSNDEYLEVEYSRNGTEAKTKLATYTPGSFNDLLSFDNGRPENCFNKITPTISYLDAGKYDNSYKNKLWKQIKSCKGLIIDLRSYPGDYMVYDFGRLLVPKSTPFFKATVANIQYPGVFSFEKPAPLGWFNPFYYKGKVVILINENTQSQAEFTAMAFRYAPNSIVLGSTTAGADGDVSIITLPGGLQTMMSAVGILYPDNGETQRCGIIPDIEVYPTVEGIKSGRDELLEKAIDWINSD